MKNKKITYALFVLNTLTIIFLIYFLYKGFYFSEYGYFKTDGKNVGIKPAFQFLVILGIVIPLLIAIAVKDYRWVSQSILIIAISFFWKEDFFQKTLFINQWTSQARVHKIVKRFVDKNEKQISGDIQKLTEECLAVTNGYDALTTIRDMSSFPYNSEFLMDKIDTNTGNHTTHRWITTYSLSPKLIKSKEYKIENITLNNKQIVHSTIILVPPDQKMWLPSVSYYPLGINNAGMGLKRSELYQLNRNFYLEEGRQFIYKEKWVIGLTGPFNWQG